MTDRDEVERAFQHYYMTGPVMEDWVGWAQLFTDDAAYFDHYIMTCRAAGKLHSLHAATCREVVWRRAKSFCLFVSAPPHEEVG